MVNSRYRHLLRAELLLPALSILVIVIGWGLVSSRISQKRAVDAKYFTIKQDSADDRKTHLSVVTADGGSPDPVNSFNVKLLKLILSKSGHPYTLTVFDHSFNQDSLVRALQTTERIPHNAIERVNVAVMGADADINKALHRIPIPVTGGMLGMRVGFAHRQFLPLTSNVKDVRDLYQLSLLQGIGWRDVEILDASGLKTYTARPNQLLQITESGQTHLFLRGVSELESELKKAKQRAKNVVLDPHLVIIYPFAGFFYVSPDNLRLAEVLEKGFIDALKDGSYHSLLSNELFTASFRSTLKLRDRRVIYLDNPGADASLAGVDQELWLLPWDDLSTGRISSGKQLCSLKSLAVLCE